MVLSMPTLVYQVLFGVHCDKKAILYRKIKRKVSIEAKTCCIDFLFKRTDLGISQTDNNTVYFGL
ncbi:hypothetical protein BCR42DRAFT_425800, partial [Absidia repens]